MFRDLLVLTSSFPRYPGDFAGNFVYELSKKLEELGLRITILSPHIYNKEFYENYDRMHIYRFPYFYPYTLQKLSCNGGFVYNLKTQKLAKLQIPLFFVSELLSTIILVLTKNIRVIHTHWFIPQGLIGAIIHKLFSVRHVCTIHAADIFSLENLPCRKLLANFIFDNCDIIFVVSSHIGNRLFNLLSIKYQKEFNLKVKILPMGININYFSNGKKNDLKSEYDISGDKNLLFLGRLSDKKGINYLIDAMPKVIERYRETKLFILGEGPLMDNLKKQVEEIGLNDCIRFAGYVTPKEKRDYLCMMDLLVVPSVVLDSGETEGLPVVILEGLASGIPIIASNVSGISDVIKDGWNGLLIEEKNPDQIADKIIKLISDKSLRDKIAVNSSTFIKKYDWNNIAKEYFEILR